MHHMCCLLHGQEKPWRSPLPLAPLPNCTCNDDTRLSACRAALLTFSGSMQDSAVCMSIALSMTLAFAESFAQLCITCCLPMHTFANISEEALDQHCLLKLICGITCTLLEFHMDYMFALVLIWLVAMVEELAYASRCFCHGRAIFLGQRCGGLRAAFTSWPQKVLRHSLPQPALQQLMLTAVLTPVGCLQGCR